jgi:hypothetical protein
MVLPRMLWVEAITNRGLCLHHCCQANRYCRAVGSVHIVTTDFNPLMKYKS